ncbi:hypothetical protein ScPMuIL_001218 [Solemya velum]
MRMMLLMYALDVAYIPGRKRLIRDALRRAALRYVPPEGDDTDEAMSIRNSCGRAEHLRQRYKRVRPVWTTADG